MRTILTDLTGVCPKKLMYKINDDNSITGITFFGGCNGNLKAISEILENYPANEIVNKFKHIECGKKGTSCIQELCKSIDKELQK